MMRGDNAADLKRRDVVEYRSDPVGCGHTGVVKWIGKNEDGTRLAVVRWHNGSHVMHRQRMLRLVKDDATSPLLDNDKDKEEKSK